MRKGAALLLSTFFAVFAVAAITITNITEWRILAKAGPVVKLGNISLHPVSAASWRTLEGLNVTTYRLCFVPGWEESYVVGRLDTRVSGLSTYLCREEQHGVASYWISLGDVLQVSHVQACGVPVQLPAALSWRSVAASEYYVLATARFTVGGARVQQFINFSAKPMSLLSSASYSCTRYTRSDDFSDACRSIEYSFEASIPNNRTFTSRGSVSRDTTRGNPPPSLRTYASSTILASGYASLFVNYSFTPFSAAASFSFDYYLVRTLTTNDYLQLHFFVDTNGDGSPDREVIYYGSGGGTSPLSMASTVYGRTLPTNTSSLPGFQNIAERWFRISIAQMFPTGYVVGLALTAYTYRSSSVDILWDNIRFSMCMLPDYISVYTRGYEYTLVYVDATRSPSLSPSLATEVDALRAANNPAADYGIAAAIYNVQQRWSFIPAANFSFNVLGYYWRRDVTEAQNNVGYVSIGVDSNNDGVVDTEFIFYRYDVVAAYPGAIISVFVSRGTLVCTVGSDGSCTPTSPSFRVFNLGTMVSGQSYVWSGNLPLDQPGSVLLVAFAIVDASYNAAVMAGDIWIWWDDFTIAYYVCTPLPPGWSVAGGTFYRSLVPGAAVYGGSFTGDGGFYVFDSNLAPLFGVRRSGYTYYARCGSAEMLLGSYPNAQWVDLRMLSGVWEAILRDSTGGIIARYACAPAGTPSYVGFTGVRGFEFRAWGCSG